MYRASASPKRFRTCVDRETLWSPSRFDTRKISPKNASCQAGLARPVVGLIVPYNGRPPSPAAAPVGAPRFASLT